MSTSKSNTIKNMVTRTVLNLCQQLIIDLTMSNEKEALFKVGL